MNRKERTNCTECVHIVKVAPVDRCAMHGLGHCSIVNLGYTPCDKFKPAMLTEVLPWTWRKLNAFRKWVKSPPKLEPIVETGENMEYQHNIKEESEKSSVFSDKADELRGQYGDPFRTQPMASNINGKDFAMRPMATQIDLLRTEINRLCKIGADRLKRIQGHDEEVSRLTRLLEARGKRIKECDREIAVKAFSISSLQSIASSLTDMQRSSSDQMKKITDELAEVKKKLSNRAAAVRSARDREDVFVRKYYAAKDKVTVLESELVAFRAQGSATPHTDRMAIKALNEQLRGKDEEIAELRADIALAGASNQYGPYIPNGPWSIQPYPGLGEARKRILDLEANEILDRGIREDLKKRIRDLEELLATKDGQNVLLEKKVSELEELLAINDGQNGRLGKNVRELQTKLDQAHIKNSEMRVTAKDLGVQLIDMGSKK